MKTRGDPCSFFQIALTVTVDFHLQIQYWLLNFDGEPKVTARTNIHDPAKATATNL